MDTEIIHIIQNAYGIDPVCLAQTRDGITFSSRFDARNKFILKACQDLPERKIFTYAMQHHLNSNGFIYTDSILKTKSGSIFTELGGGIYTCSRVLHGRQCNIENDRDLKDASILLANMHNSANGFTHEKAAEIITDVMRCTSSSTDNINSYAERLIRNELGGMLELYKHRCSELRRFQKIASRSRGRFDYEYMSIAEHYCNTASDMCAALSKSDYMSISEEYAQKGAICHRDYTSHNIIFMPGGGGMSAENGGITGFDCAAIDIPLLDITNLIKRRMRKCGWRSTDADLILNSYTRIRPISSGEIEIIKIVLTFPQKLWRIVNKYYNSRRSWCEKSCLLKLAEIKKESALINEFIKTF